MKTTVKSAAFGLMILFATVATSFNANAAEVITGAELISVGKLNNQPVFQLNLNNKVNGKYAVVVKDQFGEILHQEIVTGVNISRRFQLNTEELGNVDVRFEIVDLKASTNSTVFKVKNNMRVITETEITKG
ncbi:MAG: hypothetical protein QM725_00380 [Lacibacter sp.]